MMIGLLTFLGDFIYGTMVSVFPLYAKEVLRATVMFSSLIISINFFIFSFTTPIAGTFQSIGLAVGPVFSAFVYEYKKQYLFKGLFLIASIVLFFYLYTIKKVGKQ